MKKYFYLFTCFLVFSLITAQQNCENALTANVGINQCPTITGELPNSTCAYSNELATAANWFTFSTEVDTTVTITTDLPSNPNIDTRFRVFYNDCNNLVCLGGDDDSGSVFYNYSSVFSFNANANTTYYIAFDNRWTTNSQSSFDFEVITDSNVSESPISFTNTPINGGGSKNCLADLNGDYLDDIVSVIGSSTVAIAYQQTDGSFQRQSYSINNFYPSNWSITAGDLNGDLRNDLLFGGQNGVSLILSNEATQSFDVESSNFYIFSQRSNMIDLNNDGLLDVFVCHDVEPNVYAINSENTNYTWYQGGIGDYASGGNYGSIFVDYDNDGDQDLFIAKCRGGSDAKYNELHRNDGDGNFTDVSIESNMRDAIQTWSSAWADFDHDGDFDAYIGASSYADGPQKIMLNNADGTFYDATAGTVFETYSGNGIENLAFDFDNNGWEDIYVEHNLGGRIFYNFGNLEFEVHSISMREGSVGDLNNDGFLDIFYNGTALINDGNENNWLKIVTIGTESNTNGIGARIELTSALGTQIKEVRSGMGFAHGHTLNSHFGIGEDTTIDQIVVKWPSGIVDTYNNVDPNQTFFAVEGETLATQEVTANSKFEVYPNPANYELNIQSDVEINTKAYVYDSAGKLMTVKLQDNKLNTKNLPNGIYFLKVFDKDGNVHAKKFIVKH